MPGLGWLIRMTRWAHRPPSWQRVVLVLVVVSLCLTAAGLERLGLWPEALRVHPRLGMKAP